MSFRENKRQADTVDALEKSEVKNPRLNEPLGEEEDFALEEVLDESIEDAEIHPPPVDSKEAPIQTSRAPHKGKQKGKKSDSGGGTHFKENPFTFISSDDPIVQSCMCVYSFSVLSFISAIDSRCIIETARRST